MKIKISFAISSVLFISGCQSITTQPEIAIAEPSMALAPAPVLNDVQRIAPSMAIAQSVMVREAGFALPNTERYQTIETNAVKTVSEHPISTFSADVDTGSYSNVRRFLTLTGRLPPIDAVRIEELINYFDYQYQQPVGVHPFAIQTETVDSPWQNNAKVIKIALQAKDIQSKELAPANLVFLIDISGSMASADKLPLVKQTLKILTEQLRAQDTVTLITYASGEHVALPPTSGKDKQKILTAIDQLQAQGATSGEKAMQLAYQQAEQAFIKEGINRILMATDGDFNVGMTDFSTLKGMVAEKRKTGISLTTLGFGSGNYNEQLMEQLADAGDGNYSYIDNINEAKKVLQRQLSSTLATVAQDVKIQVEFNPATVKEYRLIGYENRQLKTEDFNNDQVDAGDIGAGHQVTALYEIIPVGVQGWLDESRYQAGQSKAASVGKMDEYAQVKVRYKLPQQKSSTLLSQEINNTSIAYKKASADTRFALAVAAYGQQLRGGQYNANMTWSDIIQLAQKASTHDDFGLKAEFVELAKTARNLSSSAKE